MQLTDAIQTRHSCRSYGQRPVTDEQLSLLLDAARRAPSAHNRQPWRFVAIRSRALIEGCYPDMVQVPFAAKADLLLLVCIDTDRLYLEYGYTQAQAFALLDIGAAIENLMLAAREQDIGTCWIGMLNEKVCRERLDLPKNYWPVSVVAMGEDLDRPRERRLRPLDQIVEYRD